MKLLLDTHIWIWSLSEPEKIGERALRELRNSENEIWLSPVSMWEALLLHAKGRVYLDDDLDWWMAEKAGGFREAPLTHEIVIAAHGLGLTHADPADRFLAATAKVLGLTLVTADRKLLGLGEIATLANR